MLPRPPSRIGPFAVVRALGRGGMGVVYEVEDPLARRRLALKLVSESAASAQASERFWREAELLARVRHPGVVTIHKLGRAAEGPYLVQELVEGAPLSALCEDGPVAPARAAELVRDLARAVEAVHAAGILHRDLKPQNVIVRARDGRPVLLDFGLAREVDSETLTKTGVPLGTPAFMSPEQARGQRDLDARTDVYGLGAVLYTLLAGRPPFEGESFVTLLARVLKEPPPPLPEQVPPDLAELCRATLAKAPADRPPTAAALALDLDRFLAGEGTRHRA
ncbi:MAG: serine/threonine protein kinase, partial [Planctomycetota bacterium]|nr:serine/threonine protein kinase [Planctomycetota bacterium]